MKWKKNLQLISLLLFPITIYYFSPAIIMYGISEQVISGSFILFAFLLVSSVFTRRLFCSTVCPAGAVQDLMTDIHNKPIKTQKIRYWKWLVFSLWLAIILYLIYEYGLKTFDPFYQTKYGISVYEPGGYIVLYGVLGIFMLLANFLGKRAGCHTICWMAPFMILGQKIGDLFKLPSYKLLKNDNTCIACGKCNQSCPMSLDIKEMVLKDQVDHNDCISCSKCVTACPKDVLEISFKK